jgi:hypothetical protein
VQERSGQCRTLLEAARQGAHSITESVGQSQFLPQRLNPFSSISYSVEAGIVAQIFGYRQFRIEHDAMHDHAQL